MRRGPCTRRWMTAATWRGGGRWRGSGRCWPGQRPGRCRRSPDDATVFTLGVIDDMAVPTRQAQQYEDPPRAMFGRFANHFGRAAKVMFITADSLAYDFRRLGPLDFAFIDGAHDLEHVLSDSRKAYEQLRP